jgi:hypothetical protein
MKDLHQDFALLVANARTPTRPHADPPTRFPQDLPTRFPLLVSLFKPRAQPFDRQTQRDQEANPQR